MREHEVNTLLHTECLLLLVSTRQPEHVTRVCAAAVISCPTLLNRWYVAALGHTASPDLREAFRRYVAHDLCLMPLPFVDIAMGKSVIEFVSSWVDLSDLAQRSRRAVENGEFPEMPDLPAVSPLTSSRLDYGLDASQDGYITPQLRARIIARSFGLRAWKPVAFPSGSATREEFMDWITNGSMIRSALAAIARGDIPADPEYQAISAMLEGHRLSEVTSLLDADPRILTALAEAAADPKSLSVTVRRAMAKMVAATDPDLNAAQARRIIDRWSQGEDVGSDMSLLLSRCRESIEVAQTYRTIAA